MSTMTIDLGAIKALSQEQREHLAHAIQKDGDLWNAVNGMGGLSEFSHQARLQGTVSDEGLALPHAFIEVFNNGVLKHRFHTNENGYFKGDVLPAVYRVVIHSGDHQETISVKALKGITSTINHDFTMEVPDVSPD